MMTAAAAMAGGLTTAGIAIAFWVVFHGDTGLSTRLSTRLGTKLRAMSRASRRRIIAALAAGVITAIVSGWVLAGVIVGTAVVGIPYLLATPPQREIAVLEALDRWIRTLATILPTGRSVSDAIRASRRQAPELLAESLDVAVRRIDERWTIREVLFAMADELATPDADAVLAALILASERGGTGTTATLCALADSTQERLRALREVEAERAKPRIVVRQVTVITLGLLCLAFVFGRDFFAPYATVTGGAILLCLLGAYVGSLAMMRRITTPRRRQRILRRAS